MIKLWKNQPARKRGRHRYLFEQWDEIEGHRRWETDKIKSTVHQNLIVFGANRTAQPKGGYSGFLLGLLLMVKLPGLMERVELL